jgi:DNA-directed RNA polymerase specialized sigma24 family protein
MDTLAIEPKPERCDFANRAASTKDFDLRCEVAAFITALPCTQRVALLLRLKHGLGYADIAAVLCCSNDHARAIVYDALRSLRHQVGDRL